eukprot:PhM_4_TR15950/c1_g1_i1/m.102798
MGPGEWLWAQRFNSSSNLRPWRCHVPRSDLRFRNRDSSASKRFHNNKRLSDDVEVFDDDDVVVALMGASAFGPRTGRNFDNDAAGFSSGHGTSGGSGWFGRSLLTLSRTGSRMKHTGVWRYNGFGSKLTKVPRPYICGVSDRTGL